MAELTAYQRALEARKKAKKQYGEMIKQPSYEETVEKAKRIGYYPQDTDTHGRTAVQRQNDLRTAATQYQQRVAAAMQQARQKPSYGQNIGRYLTTNQPFLQSRANTVLNAEQQQKARESGAYDRDELVAAGKTGYMSDAFLKDYINRTREANAQARMTQDPIRAARELRGEYQTALDKLNQEQSQIPALELGGYGTVPALGTKEGIAERQRLQDSVDYYTARDRSTAIAQEDYDRYYTALKNMQERHASQEDIANAAELESLYGVKDLSGWNEWRETHPTYIPQESSFKQDEAYYNTAASTKEGYDRERQAVLDELEQVRATRQEYGQTWTQEEADRVRAYEAELQNQLNDLDAKISNEQTILDRYGYVNDVNATAGATSYTLDQAQTELDNRGIFDRLRSETQSGMSTAEYGKLSEYDKNKGISYTDEYDAMRQNAASTVLGLGKAAFGRVGGKYGEMLSGMADEALSQERQLYTWINDKTYRAATAETDEGTTQEWRDKGYDLLTYDERKEYNVRYNRDGADAAQAFLDAMEPVLQSRRSSAIGNYYEDMGRNLPITSTAVSTAAQLMSGIAAPIVGGATAVSGLLDAAGIKGAKIDKNSSIYDLAKAAPTLRAGTGEQLAEALPYNIPGTNTNAAAFLYNALMSGVDSVTAWQTSAGIAGMLGKGDKLAKAAMQTIMSNEAAVHTMVERLQDGQSIGKALAGGVMDGLIEAATETWSIEAMFSDPKNFSRYLIQNFAAEGSEELAGDVASLAVDELTSAISGHESEMRQQINAYMAQGMTEREAQAQAVSDWTQQTVLDTLAGAISGVGIAGAGAASNAIETRQTQRVLEQQGVDSRTARTAAQELGGLIKPENGEEAVQSAVTQLETKADETGERHNPFHAEATVEGMADAKLEVTGIAEVDEKGKVKVTAKGNGMEEQTLPLEQVKFASPDERKAYELAAKMGDTQTARQYLAGYEESSLPVAVYNRAFNTVYDAGRNSRALTARELKVGYASTLSETVRQIAYNAGKAATEAQNVRLSLPAEVEGDMRTRLSKLPRTYAEGYTGVVYQAKTTRPTAAQAVMLDLLDDYGKKHGVHYTVVDTLGNGSNGVYTGADGGMVIALDAEEGYLTRVATHEGLHYIKENVREEAQGLQQYVLTLLQTTEGYDLESRIAEKQRQYKEAVGQELNRDAALEELTADALYDAIATPENLAEIAPRYPKIIEKFMDFINNFVKEVRAIMQRIGGKNPEARAMLEHEAAEAEGIIEEYNRLMEKAAEAERAGKHKKAQEMFSLREMEDGSKYVEVDTDQEVFDEVAYEELPRFVERYITNKYRGKVIGTKNRAYVDRRSAKEYAHPARKNVERSAFEAKARASAELDNIMDASEFVEHKSDDGRHKDAKGGWNEYQVKLKINDQMYQGKVSIMLMDEEGNRRRFHDLTKLKAVGEKMQGHNAPPVHYGSENNISNKVGEINPSEKFSLRDVDQNMDEVQRIVEENKTLLGIVGELKKQIKELGGTRTVDNKQVRELARSLKAEYESTVSVSDLTANLQTAFDQMANAGTDSEAKAAMTAMGAIVRDMLEKSQRVDTAMYDEYKGMRDYLRTTPIRLTDNQWQEVRKRYGSEKEFRRAVMGKLRIAAKSDAAAGTLDAHWNEIAEAWPGMFDADTVEGDQVDALLDALDATAKRVENPYEMNLDRMTQDVTAEVYDKYLAIPETVSRNSRALKQQMQQREAAEAERDAARAEADAAQARTEDVKLLNANQAAEIKRLRGELKKAQQQARTWAENREKINKQHAMRREIIRQKQRILKKLQTPQAGSFVPYQMREAVEGLLNALGVDDSTVAKQTTLTTDMLRKAKDAYEAVLPQDGNKDSGIPALADFYNGDLVTAFDELAATADGKKLNKLNAHETELLRNILNGYAAMIINEDRLFMQSKRESLKQTGDGFLAQIQTRKERMIQSKTKKFFSDALSRGLLTPTTVFGLFEGTEMEPVWRALRNAEWTHIRNVQSASEYLENALKKYDEQKEINMSPTAQLNGKLSMNGKRKGGGIEIKTDKGKNLHLTREEAMTIYATEKREKLIGTRHLLDGGVTFANTDGRAGQPLQEYKLTQNDLNKITGSLTAQQKAYVDHMVAYLSTTAAEWGNAVTRELYGVEKFNESYYIPLSVNRNYLKSDPAEQQDNRLKLGSFTKAITKNANNTVDILPFTQLWASHVEKMSDYNAFVLPIEDMTRLMNYRSEDGARVRKTIEERYGTQTREYIDSFLKRLNGNGRIEHGGHWINRFVSKAKGAAVTFNLSVAIQQAGAGPRAMAEINPKYVIPGIIAGFGKIPNLSKAYAEIEEHAPIAVEKGWGYFDTNMARGLYDRARSTARGKVDDIGGSLASKGDKLNWVQIWDAVKREVAGETDLTPGTDAYWKRCGERFTEVIDKTQVVDSIFQRAEWATEKGRAASFMSFLSEPVKQYNMLWRGLHTIVEGVQTKNKIKTKRGIKEFAKNAGGIAVSAVATAALKSIITALRDRDNEKKEEDEDGKQVIVGVRGFEDKYVDALLPNLLDNLTGLLPVFSTMAINAFSSDYGGGSSDLESAALDNTGKSVQYIKKGDYERALYYVLQAGSSAIGIGAGNAYRDVRAMILTTKDAVERDTLAGAAWDTSKDFATRVKAATKNYVYAREKDENGNYTDERKAAPDLYADLMLVAYYESGMGKDFQTVAQAALDNGATEAGLVTKFKSKLRGSSDAVTEAAEAYHAGDVDGMNKYVAEIVGTGIGTKAAYSMIQSREKELYPEEKKKEPGKAENVVESLQSETKDALDTTDTAQWREATEKAATGDAAAIAELKKLVEKLRKEGYTDKELTGKVWTLYGKDYKAAVWGGDTAAAAALEKAMTGAGVGLTKEALGEKMLDASKSAMYEALRSGDVDTAKRMKAYVEKAMGSDAYVKALKQWAKTAYPKAVAKGTGATLKKALLAMGLAESTLDGYVK